MLRTSSQNKPSGVFVEGKHYCLQRREIYLDSGELSWLATKARVDRPDHFTPALEIKLIISSNSNPNRDLEFRLESEASAESDMTRSRYEVSVLEHPLWRILSSTS